MSLTQVPVSGHFTYRDAAQTPAAGERLSFISLTKVVIDGQTVTLPKKLACTLDADGNVPTGFTLPTLGDGVYYGVRERFPGGRDDYTILVVPADTSIDLATAAPVVPPEDLVSYLGLPAVQAAQASADSAAASALSADADAATAAAAASTATTKAAEASASASAAGTSETNAGNSATAAGTSASSASTSAAAADTSAQAAATSAGAANTSAQAAAASAVSAATANLNRPTDTLTSTAGIVSIDLADGIEVYTLTLTENITGWSITPPPSGKTAELRVDVKQGSGVAYSCASPASAGRTAGGTWIVTTTLGATETLGLSIDSAGVVSLYPSGVMA